MKGCRWRVCAVFPYLADPRNLCDRHGTAEVEQLTPRPRAWACRFGTRVISDPLPIAGRWDLEPDGTGTLLRLSAEGSAQP
jgi:hypothetical protein